MKKYFISLSALLILSCGLTDIFALSIDYITNQSAQWIRNPSRNAVTNDADAVYFNPAGTALLTEGLWLELGDQMGWMQGILTAKKENKDFKTDKYEYFAPDFFAVYKTGKTAVFLGLTPVGGMGTVDSDGIASAYIMGAKNQSLKGKVYYGGITAGGAYKINDMIAVSLGLRFVGALRTVDADFGAFGEAETEQMATGFGEIIGTNLTLTKEINIGIRYETQTDLEFENDTSKNTIIVPAYAAQFADGAKQRKNLPAVLGIGVSYLLIPELTASIGGNYYFIKQADQKDTATEIKGYDDDYDNGWDATIGFEYQLTQNFLASAGLEYSDTGANKDTYSDLDMSLDSYAICAGGEYKLSQWVDLSVGYCYILYKTSENRDKSEEFRKRAMALGIAVQYKAI